MATANNIVNHQTMRGTDPFGSGRYGASRDGGSRSHNGVDINVTSGEDITSPITGSIRRKKYPYSDDLSFEGCIIDGSGEWKGYEITIYYVKMILKAGDTVSLGTKLGAAQDLSTRYKGISNHVHVEVKKGDAIIDPSQIWLAN